MGHRELEVVEDNLSLEMLGQILMSEVQISCFRRFEIACVKRIQYLDFMFVKDLNPLDFMCSFSNGFSFVDLIFAKDFLFVVFIFAKDILFVVFIFAKDFNSLDFIFAVFVEDYFVAFQLHSSIILSLLLVAFIEDSFVCQGFFRYFQLLSSRILSLLLSLVQLPRTLILFLTLVYLPRTLILFLTLV